jgi:hypothetical protein
MLFARAAARSSCASASARGAFQLPRAFATNSVAAAAAAAADADNDALASPPRFANDGKVNYKAFAGARNVRNLAPVKTENAHPRYNPAFLDALLQVGPKGPRMKPRIELPTLAKPDVGVDANALACCAPLLTVADVANKTHD